jgi:hypothetical protein
MGDERVRNMPSGAAVEERKQVRGRSTLGPLHDLPYRSVERKQAEAWCAAVYAEIGSEDRLTDLERDAVGRAGVDYARERDLQWKYAHGHPIDPADLLAAGNKFRRSEARVEALKKRVTKRQRSR